MCDGCGACVAVCPMRKFWGMRKLSPRRMVRLLRYGETKESVFCLDCFGCAEVCPQGVGLRSHLKAAGLLSVKRCSECGRPLKPSNALLFLKEKGFFVDLWICERCRSRKVALKFTPFLPNILRPPERVSLSAVQRHT